MADRLFIYGTLHPHRAPGEIRDAVKRLTPLGKGTVRGTLYDLGDYPGLVLGGAAPAKIAGEVFTLPSDPGTLACLDDYEEFRPSDPENSLFKRIKTTVTLADGTKRLCWVYVYNHPVEAELHALAS
jgi:gamma-glutamylcyclotransferase (GGCT)/AIG2-like uncharacterized protein YtfP